MFIKRREMKRSDWKRITERKYITQNIEIFGNKGVSGLILMEEISSPLEKNGVKIVEKGYKWLQIALENQNFWVTAMFDEKDNFIQIYFDITLKNYFDEPDNPQFDDLFVDIVLTTDLKVEILDYDELDQALKENIITPHQYNLAKSTTQKLSEYLKIKGIDIVCLCKDLMTEALNQIKD